MCLDLMSVLPSYKTGCYVFRKRKREKTKEGKRNIDLHGRLLQRKRNIFSLADTVFMCF